MDAAAIVTDWIQENREQIDSCVLAAIDNVKRDPSLRPPKTAGDLANGMQSWLDRCRSSLSTELRAEFRKEFGGVESRLSEDYFKVLVDTYMWPDLRAHFVSYAMRYAAAAWARKNFRDRVVLQKPIERANTWEVPVGLSGENDAIVGHITLDLDANVVESNTSTWQEIEAKVA